MNQLISEDATHWNATRSRSAESHADISWANTVDNYAYLGESSSIRHIRERLRQSICRGYESTYNRSIEGLRHYITIRFYANCNKTSFTCELCQGDRFTQWVSRHHSKANRSQDQLGPLNDHQWTQPRPLGLQETRQIGRGGARYTKPSEPAQIADKLISWPRSYCDIVGHTRDQGDRDANLALAQQRAEAVRTFLIDAGIDGHRLRVQHGSMAPAKKCFVLGEVLLTGTLLMSTFIHS